nr:hypothetical protein Iba_chr14eCG0800 [Ipomoea batatas]
MQLNTFSNISGGIFYCRYMYQGKTSYIGGRSEPPRGRSRWMAATTTWKWPERRRPELPWFISHSLFFLPMLCCVCLISDSFCFHCFCNPKRDRTGFSQLY